MTKDEINRKVAEKVMGFRQLQGYSKWWFPAKEPVTLDDAIIDWNPSERIDHAWMVVEKLITDEKMIIGSVIYDQTYGGWRFRYRAYDELLHPDAGPWADTAPMAISLAALEAVKEK